MTKIIARAAIYAGEHSVFASTVCKQLLGKQVMGGRVIAAKQTKPDEIWLTFEIELDVISTGWFVPGQQKETCKHCNQPVIWRGDPPRGWIHSNTNKFDCEEPFSHKLATPGGNNG